VYLLFEVHVVNDLSGYVKTLSNIVSRKKSVA
jgi:hypothetical protein